MRASALPAHRRARTARAPAPASPTLKRSGSGRSLVDANTPPPDASPSGTSGGWLRRAENGYASLMKRTALLSVVAVAFVSGCLSQTDYMDPTYYAPQVDASGASVLSFTGAGTLTGDIGPV